MTSILFVLAVILILLPAWPVINFLAKHYSLFAYLRFIPVLLSIGCMLSPLYIHNVMHWPILGLAIGVSVFFQEQHWHNSLIFRSKGTLESFLILSYFAIFMLSFGSVMEAARNFNQLQMILTICIILLSVLLGAWIFLILHTKYLLDVKDAIYRLKEAGRFSLKFVDGVKVHYIFSSITLPSKIHLSLFHRIIREAPALLHQNIAGFLSGFRYSDFLDAVLKNKYIANAYIGNCIGVSAKFSDIIITNINSD